MAEEEERRLVMTGSACLDKFVVDTDRLSASRTKQQTQLEQTNDKLKRQKMWEEIESGSQHTLRGYSTLFGLNTVRCGKTTNVLLREKYYKMN